MSETKKEKADLKAGASPAAARENVVMPQAAAVEKSLLSMMTLDPNEIIPRSIMQGITEDFFYVPSHRILWQLLRQRYEKNQTMDVTSVAQELTDRNQLEAVGGHPGLMDIYSLASSSALFESHFEQLREKYIRRAIIQSSNRSASAAFTSENEVESLLDQAEQDVLQIRQNMQTGKNQWSLEVDIRKFVDSLERIMKDGETGPQGLSTGFEKLDKMSNGLKPGDLFVVAARPSMGKTSFLMNIVEHVILDEKKPALVFSCEMPSAQLVERLLLARAGVSKQHILAVRKPKKEVLKKITESIRMMKESRLIIDDTAGISISELRAKARRVVRDHPDLACIGVDYLQLMRSHTKQAQNSREREIAEISGGLKNLAKELQVPIVVLAQLNRGPENRPGRTKGIPMMSDLRESGAIEQDADMIGLLYRNAYYATNDEEREQEGDNANLLLAKNRNGPTGDVPLSFKADIMRFVTRVVVDDEEAGGGE